jgi:hypothetical protein
LYEGGRNGYRSGGENAVYLESDKKQDNGKKIKKKLHGVDLSLNVAIGSIMAIILGKIFRVIRFSIMNKMLEMARRERCYAARPGRRQEHILTGIPGIGVFHQNTTGEIPSAGLAVQACLGPANTCFEPALLREKA